MQVASWLAINVIGRSVTGALPRERAKKTCTVIIARRCFAHLAMTRSGAKACVPGCLASVVVGRFATFVCSTERARAVANTVAEVCCNVIIATCNCVSLVVRQAGVEAKVIPSPVVTDVIGRSATGALSRGRARRASAVTFAIQHYAHRAMTRARAKAYLPYCLAADVVRRSVTIAWAT